MPVDGTDVVTTLALGARAVCIGRPYLWGLGAFGRARVERVLERLHQETRAAGRRALVEAPQPGAGAARALAHPSVRRPASYRNQVRCSVSSIQFSIRLAVAIS